MTDHDKRTSASNTPVYRIKSVSDFHQVPQDRLGACMTDLVHWLSATREGGEVSQELSILIGTASGINFDTGEFVWADDGCNGTSRLDFLNPDDGTTIASIIYNGRLAGIVLKRESVDATIVGPGEPVHDGAGQTAPGPAKTRMDAGSQVLAEVGADDALVISRSTLMTVARRLMAEQIDDCDEGFLAGRAHGIGSLHSELLKYGRPLSKTGLRVDDIARAQRGLEQIASGDNKQPIGAAAFALAVFNGMLSGLDVEQLS